MRALLLAGRSMRALLLAGAACSLGCGVHGAVVSCDPFFVDADDESRQRCPDLRECPKPPCPQGLPGVDKGMCRCPCAEIYLSQRLKTTMQLCCVGKENECGFRSRGSGSLAAIGQAFSRAITGHLPNTCSDACASSYIDLYEECSVELSRRTPMEGAPAWKSFYNSCMETNSAEGTCEDSPTWKPSANVVAPRCTNALDDSPQGGVGSCDKSLAAGYKCTQFATGKYKGYCDKSCSLGVCHSQSAAVVSKGECPALLGPTGVDRCHCDSYGGIQNCAKSCDALCSVQGTPALKKLTVDGIPVSGSITDSCPALSGRHQWFTFQAQAGKLYQLNTVLVPGGLTSTYLHLHAMDAAQSELLTVTSWHCPTAMSLGSCAVWACIGSGTYAIRVSQMAGKGPYKVQVKDVGPIENVAAAEGLYPLIYRDPDKVHFSFSKDRSTKSWGATINVGCQLTYCRFSRNNHALAGGKQPLTSDGENFLMALSVPKHGAGATYNFSFALATPAVAAYIKMVVYPRKTAGGGSAFEDDFRMSREIKLGKWKGGGKHRQYRQYNPDFDLKEYKTFPGEVDSTTGHFAWVAPADGDYFVKFTSNCDVPLLGDVDGNMNLQTGRTLPGHEAAMGCRATWKMALTVEDKSAVVVVPIISIAPSGCVNEAGGGCAAAASSEHAHSALPIIHTMKDVRATRPSAVRLLASAVPLLVSHVEWLPSLTTVGCAGTTLNNPRHARSTMPWRRAPAWGPTPSSR